MLHNHYLVYQINKQRHQERIDQARKHDLIRELRDEQTEHRVQVKEALSVLREATIRLWTASRQILNPGLKHHTPQV